MKLYYQNNGWMGSITVIAENEQQARALMMNEYNYDPENSIEELEIKVGLVISNYGDM